MVHFVVSLLAKLTEIVPGFVELLVQVDGVTAFRRQARRDLVYLPSAGVSQWNFLIQDLGRVLDEPLQWDISTSPISQQMEWRSLIWTPLTFGLPQTKPRIRGHLVVGGENVGELRIRAPHR